MTVYGSARQLGPLSRGEKPVGNEFFTTLNSAVSGSPLAITTSMVTLSIPDNCVEVVLCGDAAWYYSEDSTFTSYFRVPADMVIPIGVAQMTSVYVKAVTTANLSYKWVII